MKKTLSIIISLVLAFVMGLSLMACNGDPTGGNEPGGTTPGGTTPGGTTPGGNEPGGSETEDPKAGITQKAIDAIDELVKGDGFKGGIGFEFTSDARKTDSTALDVNMTVEKRGESISVVMDGDTHTNGYIANINTGYLYTLGADSKISDYKQLFPEYTVDYIKATLKNYIDDENNDIDVSGFDEAVEYDGATKTMTYTLDVKPEANGALEPLYDAYKKKSSLTTLLDNYLIKYTDGQMSFMDNPLAETSLAETIKTYVNLLSTQTVSSINETFKAAGIDIKALLEENGIDLLQLLASYGVEITEQQLYARTLGQMIVGAYNALVPDTQPTAENDTTEPTPDEPTEPTPDEPSIVEQLLPVLLKGMFVDEANGNEAAKVAETALAMLKGVTDSFTVDALVEMLKSSGCAPELVAFVEANVKFTELGGGFTLKFDNEYRISELNASFKLSHDYKGDTTGFAFLSDNNYTLGFDIAVTEYLTDPAAFSYEYASGLTVPNVKAIIYGEKTSDLEVTVDLGGRTVGLDLDAATASAYGAYAEYKNGKVVFKADYLNNYFKTAATGDTLSSKFVATGGAFEVTVDVVYVSQDPKDVIGYIMSLITAGGDNQPPEITE